ncbi:MAG: dNTP triphosphohydrolase [Candidatus Cloacimonetes bacterium]|nr:dNTP triphosphohydrolase [Candidatus Cloacimonadota bacterium]
MGHPPFGHVGEETLDKLMINNGGFESNAQTLRLLTKLEKKYQIDGNLMIGKNRKDTRVGLNLTFRTIASILKYDSKIPESKNDRDQYNKTNNMNKKFFKGYYKSEEDVVNKIKKNVLKESPKYIKNEFKTIECQIMDIADDIVYSTFDLEDALKAKFLSPFSILFASKNMLERVKDKVNENLQCDLTTTEIRDILFGLFGRFYEMDNMMDILRKRLPNEKDFDFNDTHKFPGYVKIITASAYNTSQLISQDGHLRTDLTSGLIGKFIRGVKLDAFNNECPPLSKVSLYDPISKEIEVLKRLTYESQIMSPNLKIYDYAGKDIIENIFKILNKKGNHELLPMDFRDVYLAVEGSEKDRTICDFIAGMTDQYAIQFHSKLTSRKPGSFFMPTKSTTLS